MSIKTYLIAAAALAGVALPGAASAQRYGHDYYGGQGRYERGYDARGGYGYDNGRRFDDRRDRWHERRRWREIQRRRAWAWQHHRRDRYDRW